jgi:hypothetical protein
MYISLEVSDFHRPCNLSSLSPPGIPFMYSAIAVAPPDRRLCVPTELDPRQQRPEFL